MENRHSKNSAPGKRPRFGVVVHIVALVLALLIPAQALADGDALWRSALLPGTGQAHQGNYKKAALFAGLAVSTGIGLLISQVHYNQASEQYRDFKRVYLSYPDRLAKGDVISIDEIDQTYNDMSKWYDSADNRIVWRNAFLTAFIATYALNIVDVIVSKEHDPETAQRIEIEKRPTSVLVTAKFGF